MIRRKRRIFTARPLAAGGALVGTLVLAVGVFAYWTTTGTGSASAGTGTLTSPVVDATNPVAGTAHIEWTAVPAPDGPTADDEVEYTVERKPNAGSTWIYVCNTGTTPKAHDELECDDHPTVEDDYDYRVTAYFRSWTSQGTDTVHVETDAIPPVVESIERDDDSPTNASSVTWIVTFSEPVTGVDETDFELDGSGASGASIAGISGSDDEYSVEVNAGADGTLGLNLVDDDSIADGASNPLGGTGTGNGDATGQVYVIDRTAASVSSVTRDAANPTNAASVSWIVTFSESVTGVDPSDFALAATGLDGSPSVGAVTPASGQTYTVTATTGTRYAERQRHAPARRPGRRLDRGRCREHAERRLHDGSGVQHRQDAAHGDLDQPCGHEPDERRPAHVAGRLLRARVQRGRSELQCGDGEHRRHATDRGRGDRRRWSASDDVERQRFGGRHDRRERRLHPPRPLEHRVDPGSGDEPARRDLQRVRRTPMTRRSPR